jgi:multidrug resistance efflux pump
MTTVPLPNTAGQRAQTTTIAAPSKKTGVYVQQPGMQHPPGVPGSEFTGIVQSLQLLLKVERDSRQAKTLDELWFIAANESRRALQARQVFILEPRGEAMRMLAVSSLSKVERESPTILWLEKLAQDCTIHLGDKPSAQGPIVGFASGQDAVARVFPFPHVLLAPMLSADKATLACLMAVRESPFGEAETMAAERLAEAFAYCAVALGGTRRLNRYRKGKALASAVFAIVVAALIFVPVPMTVLAPAEVVARDSFLVTAPVEGTIDKIAVETNQSVKAGDILVRFVDTAPRNQLAIAEQELAVAEAKWRLVSFAAFNDPNARRDITTVNSERNLKRAERDYAIDLLARTVIRAERDGLAIFADKRELIGRPVQTGQRLMEIADPTKMRIRAHAPVDDAMALKPGSRLKLFPDADPLNPVEAVVSDTGHQARQTEAGGLAFRVDADIPASALDRLRIGHRGTAQIFGESTSLGFFLFRRPLSALRQKLGL